MPDQSALLGLPFLQPSQAQKHVTHNEALEKLDMLVQLSVIATGAETPPAAPAEGAAYTLGAAPTGAWAGQAGAVALFQDAAWQFLAPREGWRAWDQSAGEMRYWTGTDWAPPAPLPDTVDKLGIGTAADAVNKLAVAAEATLLSHAGAGHQLKLNKAGAADTAALLFQSNWTGHAEIGLAGDTDLSIKVSPDGGSWAEALRFDAASGTVAGGAAVQAAATDPAAGRLLPVGGFGLGAATPPQIDDFAAALHPGFYRYSEATTAGAPGPGAAFQGFACVLRAVNGAAMVLAGRQTVTPSSQRFWIGTRSTETGALAWQELFHPHNLLGPVSQAGGVPTGAVIESGSNGNGTYVRWADGTQICTNDGAAIVTDPAPFTGPVTSIDGDKLRIGRWF